MLEKMGWIADAVVDIIKEEREKIVESKRQIDKRLKQADELIETFSKKSE